MWGVGSSSDGSFSIGFSVVGANSCVICKTMSVKQFYILYQYLLPQLVHPLDGEESQNLTTLPETPSVDA